VEAAEIRSASACRGRLRRIVDVNMAYSRSRLSRRFNSFSIASRIRSSRNSPSCSSASRRSTVSVFSGSRIRSSQTFLRPMALFRIYDIDGTEMISYIRNIGTVQERNYIMPWQPESEKVIKVKCSRSVWPLCWAGVGPNITARCRPSRSGSGSCH
jgi:hypothetical protein